MNFQYRPDFVLTAQLYAFDRKMNILRGNAPWRIERTPSVLRKLPLMVETYCPASIAERVTQTVEVWESCAQAYVPAGREFTADEQVQREHAYDDALTAVEQEVETTSPDSPTECAGTERRVLNAFARFSASALHLEPEAIRVLEEDFIPVGFELSVWARQFDPTLSMAAIIQACRNAWTACGMQPLFGLPVKLTRSILGYSLLYPYSDNYLDQENLSADAKLRFSGRFLDMLRGETVAPANDREAAITALIQLIETEYPRTEYPDVFESLIAIHRAQEKSIRQITPWQSFRAQDVLRLSCEKGGTSVLADACLVRPALSTGEARFAFEWGVLLQLGDDLQDLRDDLDRGSVTLFSLAAAAGKPMDALAVQLLQFGEEVGARMNKLPNGTASLKDLLTMSWRSLIIGAVAASGEFFSEEFLAQAERASPFRFPFLRARRERIDGRSGLYAGIFEALLRARVRKRNFSV